MPGLSIHVVDVARGVVAQGLAVRVERLEGPVRIPIAQGTVGTGGSVDALAGLQAQFPAGVYEATFHVGDYLRALGGPVPSPLFLDVVPYRFGIADARQHYHLPFKFTAWGYSCFRGGA